MRLSLRLLKGTIRICDNWIVVDFFPGRSFLAVHTLQPGFSTLVFLLLCGRYLLLELIYCVGSLGSFDFALSLRNKVIPSHSVKFCVWCVEAGRGEAVLAAAQRSRFGVDLGGIRTKDNGSLSPGELGGLGGRVRVRQLR